MLIMKHILLPTVLLLGLASALSAQTTLQVATKTIRKTVPWKPGYEISINCEKAEVEVVPSGENSIRISAELSARHPRLDSADYDLKAWQFVVSTIGKKIYIRAYIGLKSGEPAPHSSLKAVLKLSVPASCPVDVSNKFGKAHLEKLDGAVALHGEFCSFQLVQLSGKIDLESRFGDVEGRQLSGPVQMQVKRADIELSGLTNSCQLKSEYGQVKLETSERTGDVTVVSTKSDVHLRSTGLLLHNYDLRNTYGTVSVDSNLPFKYANPDKNTHQASFKKANSKKNIRVEAQFGSIQLD